MITKISGSTFFITIFTLGNISIIQCSEQTKQQSGGKYTLLDGVTLTSNKKSTAPLIPETQSLKTQEVAAKPAATTKASQATAQKPQPTAPLIPEAQPLKTTTPKVA